MMLANPRPLGEATCPPFLSKITPHLPVIFPPPDSEICLPSLPRAHDPFRKGPWKGIRGNRAGTRVTSAFGQQRAQSPCWPPCTGRSTAACHSCLRKLWARSSRCSRGRRGLWERHSSVRQGDGSRPASGSSYIISALNPLGTALRWGGGRRRGERGLHDFPPNHPCSSPLWAPGVGRLPPSGSSPAPDTGSGLWNSVRQRPAAEEGVPGKATLQGGTAK